VQGKFPGALDAKTGSSSQSGPFTPGVAAQNDGDHALTVNTSEEHRLDENAFRN
jgi:hypothetical protein